MFRKEKSVNRQREGALRTRRASLESLIEGQDLGIEILHPGGLNITRELAALCHIGRTTKVLDVASGTGESACYLIEMFGCNLIGVDLSDYMVHRAREKAVMKKVPAAFAQADAHRLPFRENEFDVVLCECTLCIFDKRRALIEMMKVIKPGGFIGIHDLFWKSCADERLKGELVRIEGERPETFEGWISLFRAAGLESIQAFDRTDMSVEWMKTMEKSLGWKVKVKIAFNALREWGIKGLIEIFASLSIFQSKYLGYAIIVGRKV